MPETAGLPFWELHFDKSGKLLKHVGAIPSQITDLFVFAHPWNNDYNDAKDLYNVFFEHLAEELVEHGAKPDIQVGLAGVFWPSVLWPGDEPPLETTGTPMFGPVERHWSEEVKTAYEGVDERAAIDRMRELIEQRTSHPDAIAQFKILLGALAPAGKAQIEDLAALAPADASSQTGYPQAVSRLWHGAEQAIRLTVYAEMEARAHVVGENGLGAFLATLPDTIRVHLMGFQSGSSLVLSALRSERPNVHSLFLMGLDNADGLPQTKPAPVIDTHADILDHQVARAALAAAGIV
jgi:hypothetical protein